MPVNRGELIYKTVKNKGISLSELSRRMGMDRSTVFRHTQKDDLDDSLMLRYGKALDYDFTKDLPELYGALKMVNEPSPEYRNKTYDELLNERDYYKDKYINLLEKYNELIIEKYSN